MTKPQQTTAVSSGFWAGLLAHPYFLLILTPMFWGGNWVAGKMAVGHIEPVVLLTARFGGALLVIIPFAWPHLRRDWPKLRPRLAFLLALGGIGFAGFNALMYVGAHYTSALNGSIEQAAIPVIVMLGNFVIFKVRARLLQLVGVTVTILGVALTAADGDFMRLVALKVSGGDALVMLACFVYAAYSLALRYRPAIHWMSFLAVTLGGAFLVALALQATLGGGLQHLGTLAATSPRGWLIIVYVALFPSIISQLFYARGVEMIGPNRASLFINLIPVYGTILSVVVVGEHMQPYHFTTGFMVVVGIVLAEWAARRAFGDTRKSASLT